MTPAIVVLDMGKTVSKVSCWTDDGTLIERRTRSNVRIGSAEYAALDVANNESWLVDTLRAMAAKADVQSIIPVGHGAAAAILRKGRLAVPPFDYESAIPDAVRSRYKPLRDPFSLSGSPALPNGLNLGMQLFYLQTLHPDLFTAESCIVPWAQYWSYLLCGVAASEVSSLGCHTDLWRPMESAPSELSLSQGWARHMAPLRRADDVLGALSQDWASRTGLSTRVLVHCGVHDSNSALLAARVYPQIAEDDATVLSTGTWFIGMRSVRPPNTTNITALDEKRDCLVNVDVYGTAVPSARFMGGREIEILTASMGLRIDDPSLQKTLLSAAYRVLTKQSFVLPSFAPGSGPFAERQGMWVERPGDSDEQAAAICLYAALVADASLDLIDARNALLVEGRFAACELFVRALASLRLGSKVYVTSRLGDASFGALRLLRPQLQPPTELLAIAPLPDDLHPYRQRWRELAAADGT
jgi:sugar (pentulose or hexulose) kinase